MSDEESRARDAFRELRRAQRVADHHVDGCGCVWCSMGIALENLYHEIERREQEAREEERDRIAHLFDYLYPHWARTIREYGSSRAERPGSDFSGPHHQTEGWKS